MCPEPEDIGQRPRLAKGKKRERELQPMKDRAGPRRVNSSEPETDVHDKAKWVDNKHFVLFLSMPYRHFQGHLSMMTNNGGFIKPENLNAMIEIKMLLSKAAVNFEAVDFEGDTTIRTIVYPEDAKVVAQEAEEPIKLDEEKAPTLLPPEPLRPDAKSVGIEVRTVAFFLYPSLRYDLQCGLRREVTTRTLQKLQRQFNEVFPKTYDEFPHVRDYEQITPIINDVLASKDLFKAIRFMWKYVREVDAYHVRINGERSACRHALIEMYTYLKTTLQFFTERHLDRWEPPPEDEDVSSNPLSDDEEEGQGMGATAMVVEGDVFCE